MKGEISVSTTRSCCTSRSVACYRRLQERRLYRSSQVLAYPKQEDQESPSYPTRLLWPANMWVQHQARLLPTSSQDYEARRWHSGRTRILRSLPPYPRDSLQGSQPGLDAGLETNPFLATGLAPLPLSTMKLHLTFKIAKKRRQNNQKPLK